MSTTPAAVQAAAPSAPPQPTAPRLTAVPRDLEADNAALRSENDSLLARGAVLQAQFDLLAAEHAQNHGRVAVLEWQMRGVLARVGGLEPVPEHLAAFAGVEPCEGAGLRRTFKRSALLAACAERTA